MRPPSPQAVRCCCRRRAAVLLLLLLLLALCCRRRLLLEVCLPDADGSILAAAGIGGGAGRKAHIVHRAVVACVFSVWKGKRGTRQPGWRAPPPLPLPPPPLLAGSLTLADLQLRARLKVVQAHPHVAAARHKPAPSRGGMVWKRDVSRAVGTPCGSSGHPIPSHASSPTQPPPHFFFSGA